MTEVKNPERIVTNCPVPLSVLELCSIIQPLVLWLAASVEHYFGGDFHRANKNTSPN